MDIDVIRSKSAPDNHIVLTTTAENGANFSKYSTKSFSSYSQLKKDYSISRIVTLHQQHFAEVIKVHLQNYLAAEGASADGLFTTDHGLALGILTADCYPVILIGDKGVSGLHCGWRSAVKGIIQNSVKLFKNIGDIPKYAYIGPGISAKAFEVRADFVEIVSAFIDPAPYLKEEGGKIYFDLQTLITSQLQEAGVAMIENVNMCTYGNERFHSYRRNGGDAGRMLTFVYKRPLI